MKNDRSPSPCASRGTSFSEDESNCQAQAEMGLDANVSTLSSCLTGYYKFVFGPLWIAVTGIIGFAVVGLMFTSRDPVGTLGALIFSAMAFCFAFFGYWAFIRLKKVKIDGSNLTISNYSQSIVVPLRNVESIDGSLLIGPELVWIRFRQPTVFGESIQFAAKWRVFYGFTKHPIVGELLALVEDAKN